MAAPLLAIKGKIMRVLRSFCIVFTLFLAACGFTPIYGSHENSGPVAEALNNVQLSNIPDRQGQELRNHLIDRMYGAGRPQKPTTKLDVSIHSTEVDLGIQQNATATRQEYNLWADYSLKDKDGKELLKGTAHSVVSYSKLAAQYGTLMTEKDAHERATTEVSEQIINRISLYFAEQRPEDLKKAPPAAQPENQKAEEGIQKVDVKN
jgi:LPS-assembly lipoprotein